MSASTLCRRLVLFALALVLLPAVLLEAQPMPEPCSPVANNCSGGTLVKLRCVDVTDCSDEAGAENPQACTPTGCGVVNNCLAPTVSGPRIDVVETCLGMFTARLVVDVTARWNEWAGSHSPSGATKVIWYPRATVPAQCESPGVPTYTCDYAAKDRFETFVEQTGLSCTGAPYNFGVYSVQVKVCQQPCACGFSPNCICGPSSGENVTWKELSGLSFTVTRQMLGCDGRPPRKDTCGPKRCSGFVGPGVDAAGDGPCFAGGTDGPFSTGPGATLRYTARGVGFQGHPKHAQVSQALGRFWLHPYAQAIVQDPDAAHVWLLAADATYREFFDANSDGLYELASPSDEHRTLTHSAAGWRLRDLDGSVMTFDSSGRWLETADKNGNAKVGTLNASGQLTKVTMPDGREEDFLYEVSGKLKAIIERGVGITDCAATPAGCRRWEYLWSGPDLAEISRPDGTLLRFSYGDLRYPGYLTRLDLLGTTAGTTARPRRVLAAYEYDGAGNVARAWRGDPSSTGLDAVDKWQLTYDDPALPVVTTVTDPLGAISTYTFGRDTGSEVPRLEILSGDCPSCGVGPNTRLFYEDLDHPLLPTRALDGNGHETAWTYDEFGQVLSKTEAAGTPLERVTLFEHHPNFPAFVTRIVRPSVAGASARESLFTYDPATGDRLQARESGGEATYPGGAFALTTTTSFNPEGQPLTIDPPGYGTADVTSFTYDPTRGNLLPETRTDPLVGVTSFSYDLLNRRSGVRDANGALTETRYDALSRVTHVIRRSNPTAQPGDPIVTADLVTLLLYNAFGDLDCQVLPQGNGQRLLYDSAGRLTEIRRGKALASPTISACLDNALERERVVYTLNGAGQRVRESHARSTSSTAWASPEAETAYAYTTRCHLDKVTQAPGKPEESISEFAYECAGNLARTWDGNHPSSNQTAPATMVYSYDALDRLLSATQPWGGAGGGTVTTTYDYDVQDHLTRVEDGERNVTTYTTSDRDLMTAEASPVSGTTTHLYNDHGELTQTTDARGVVVSRTVDAADRVTSIDYPLTALDTTYTYEDAAVPLSQGRLTRIVRGSAVTDYRYDLFGRTIQDGALAYTLDENGNRLTIGYPGGVTALFTYDAFDRPKTLKAQRPGLPDQNLVTAAGYRASGPLSSLTFANTVTEARLFDGRYAPDRITMKVGTTTRLDWDYTVDRVGNPTFIQNVITPSLSRTYGYQDFQYFLTQGDGPWNNNTPATRSWTFDRIGNRLTETRDGVTDSHTYAANGLGGHTPTLAQVTLGALGTRSYTFGPAGHLSTVAASGNTVTFTHDAAGQLGRLARAADAFTDFSYDGRGFLVSATGEIPPAVAVASVVRGAPGTLIFADGFESGDVCNWTQAVGAVPAPNCPKPQSVTANSTYSSEGKLLKLAHENPTEGTEDITLFYFGERPVALRELANDVETWKWITTDHLGTPIALTSSNGTPLWRGGFEPYGQDFAGATAAGMFLRLPGQWTDPAWETSGLGAGVFYNVHRWYEGATGRYASSDPLGLSSGANLFSYALSSPITASDVLGLKVELYCHPIGAGGDSILRKFAGAVGFGHCFVRVQCDCGAGGESYDYRLEVTGRDGTTGLAEIPDPPQHFQPGHNAQRVQLTPPDDDSSNCSYENCVVDQYRFRALVGYPYGTPPFGWVFGPNSNTFAAELLQGCGAIRIEWPPGVPPFNNWRYVSYGPIIPFRHGR